MAFDRATCDREAESGAAAAAVARAVGAVERLQDARKRVRRDAGPVGAHIDQGGVGIGGVGRAPHRPAAGGADRDPRCTARGKT